MKLSQIDKTLLEDIRSPDHPSDFMAYGDYSVLILRLPEVKNNEVTVVSYAFVTQQNHSYIFDRDQDTLVALGSLRELEEFLDEKTETLIKHIKNYHFEIEALEEGLYEGDFKGDFMQRWLNDKKDVSLIYRLLFHASFSFELFIKHLKKHSPQSFEALAYEDVYEHMLRIRDLAQAAIDKLDHLYDFYRAKVDEKMNRNVYYLTLLSGVFLPLTLITGFFGMNTGGLPFTDDPNGTWEVMAIALILEVLFFAPFLFMNSRKIKRFKRNACN